MSAEALPLPADLVDGLRRLKLATIRAQAAEILQTARTQRWPLEEVLRTLVTAEITARDQTNRLLRLKAADVRAILMAGTGVPTPIKPGRQLQLDLPEVPIRPLSAYAVAKLR